MCAVPLFTVKILLPPGLNPTTSTVVVRDLNLADEDWHYILHSTSILSRALLSNSLLESLSAQFMIF
jgi:hypothetical protein